jgi:hypothetical protein
MAMTVTDHATVLRRLIDAAVTGNSEAVTELVTDDVTGWSPNLFVASSEELRAAMDVREETFTNIDATVDTSVIGDKAFAEWTVSADHTGPLILDDDLVVEATGRRVFLAGATCADFTGDRISAFRHYFDDLAFAEQVLSDG